MTQKRVETEIEKAALEEHAETQYDEWLPHCGAGAERLYGCQVSPSRPRGPLVPRERERS